jgi:S1-C subfamily serine protease
LTQDRENFWIVERTKAIDNQSDRCLVRVERSKGALRAITGIRPFDELEVGEKVYSIGTPRGLEKTIADGIISGLLTRSNPHLIQTTAPISPGSSGGGLFDAYGNLIGITTLSLKESQNINFAIAADTYFN